MSYHKPSDLKWRKEKWHVNYTDISLEPPVPDFPLPIESDEEED
jgi:hypothetical protein